MQTVSAAFDTASKATTRRPIAKSEISWTKVIDPDLSYFTIGLSPVGGTDYIKGTGNPISDSAVFDFADESQYLESIEIEYYADGKVFSVAKAQADIVLDNNSGRFTPSGGSNIDTLIKPRRLMRLSTGFSINGDNKYVQNFIGVSVDRPNIDTANRLLTMHGLDFSVLIWSETVKNTVMFTDTTADIIIQYLLESLGISSSLLDLEIGANVIPFAFFQKGDNIGNIIEKLCEAEMARFYVDELGVFHFQTRSSWNRSPYNVSVLDITDDMVINQKELDVTNIVNSVEIVAFPREVQDRQVLYRLDVASGETKQIQSGEQIEFFLNFTDPIYAVDTPSRTDANSYFAAGYTNDPDDASASQDVELVGWDVFSNAIKVTLHNLGSSTVYVNRFQVWGQPATIIGGKDGVQVKVTDETSIDEFGEQLVTIQNDYIQSESYATTYANIMIADRSDISDYQVLTIKALPQLQLGDLVTRNGLNYNIVRNRLRFTASDGFTQELTIVRRTVESYFTIEQSFIAGSDIIAP